MGRPRVAWVAADPQRRRTWATRVGAAPGLTPAGDYRSVDHALRGLRHERADVLLLDVHPTGEGSLDAVRQLRSAHARVSVLVLTDGVERSRICSYLSSGAVGCLLGTVSPERLVMAIEDAAAGGSPLSPEIARTLVSLFQRTGPPTAAVAVTLTSRERALLSLMAQGRSYQAAADEMGISINTVRNYVRSIYEKLDVHSMGEAIARGFRRGLI